MHENFERLAPRDCLHPPIPQLHEAADLLGGAADALLAREFDHARNLLRMADMPVVHAYASRIMGRLDANIHRYLPMQDVADTPAPSSKAAQRMPSRSVEWAIYQRDGYRCRFCGCRVVLRAARDAMRALVPDVIRWGRRSKDMHGAFFALTATLDHVVPHSRGGTNDTNNLLTTCWPCNFGRNSALIEEMSLLDPRLRPPVLDTWDGLGRMLTPKLKPAVRVNGSKERPTPNDSGKSDAPHASHAGDVPAQQAWFDQLDRRHQGATARLLRFLEECRELQVSWRLNEVLLIYVPSKDGLLSVFGIEPDGKAQVPWWIGPHKRHFQPFAEAVAAAVPGAVAYETPRMWCVRKTGCNPRSRQNLTVTDLLDAAPAIKSALSALNRVLTS